MINNGIHPVLA